jgi:glycosyltransferase involved in cell wall biosynthesis
MTLVLYADPALRSSAGIERYARELIRAAFSGEWAERTVLLTSARSALEELLRGLGCAGAPVVETRLSARALRYAWSFAGVPAADALVRARTGRRVKLVHNPANLRTPARGCPQVVTIHDMFMFKTPALRTLRQRLVASREMEERAVSHSAHMIAPSQSTKQDIVELFGTPGDRITVVPHGVDHRWFRPRGDAGALARLRERLGIPERYVLYVGSLYSRKVGKLLEGYARVARELGPDECKLVLVGGRESTAEGEVPLAERIRRLGLERWVVRTGELPAEDVPVLMSGAAVFTYVSLYEGFGFSPLEAMACGAPVIVSRATSLPEVVGDAGVLVDPADVTAIGEAMLRVLGDPAHRAELARRSLARAREFSWPRMAREHFAVYGRMMERA